MMMLAGSSPWEIMGPDQVRTKDLWFGPKIFSSDFEADNEIFLKITQKMRCDITLKRGGKRRDKAQKASDLERRFRDLSNSSRARLGQSKSVAGGPTKLG